MLKSKLFLSLLMLAPQAYATAPSGSGYPYIAESNCKKNAKVPENSGGILFNRECTIGFVLPENVGQATLTPRASASLRLCDNLAAMQDEVIGLNDLIKPWRQELKDSKDLQRTKEIVETIKELKALQTESLRQLDHIEGMKVNVLFENKIANTVNRAQELNAGDGIIYQAAQISQGRLQYIVASPANEDGIIFGTVLKSTLPGNGRVIDGDQGEIDFSGAAQGELTLSLAGACPFVKKEKKQNQTFLTIDQQAMNHTITANYTYAIPVIATASYTASLDIKAAFGSLIGRTATTEKFNRSEYVDSLVNTEGSNALQIHISKLEIPAGSTNDKFEEMIKDGIAERLTQRFLDILKEQKYVTAGAPEFKQPEAMTDSKSIMTRQCRSSSSLWGIIRSSSCYDVPYTVTVDVANRAQVFSNLVTQWNVPITENVEINDIIYRRNSSTFNIAPTTKVFMELK